MRPRDPRDYFDRLSAGDILEDPYGHTNSEAQEPAALFLSFPLSTIPQKNAYQFIESIKSPNQDRRYPTLQYKELPVFTGEKYWLYKLSGRDVNGREIFIAKQTSHLKSQYGYTWNEVRTSQDELYGVIGGELIVKELVSDEILGLKRGFFYIDKTAKKIQICPYDKSDMMTFDFISKVLIPVEVTQGEEG